MVTGLAVAVGILAGSLVAGITDLSWPESAVPAALTAGAVAGAGVALGQWVERRRAAARTATRE